MHRPMSAIVVEVLYEGLALFMKPGQHIVVDVLVLGDLLETLRRQESHIPNCPDPFLVQLRPGLLPEARLQMLGA